MESFSLEIWLESMLSILHHQNSVACARSFTDLQEPCSLAFGPDYSFQEKSLKVHPSASMRQVSCQPAQHLLHWSLSWAPKTHMYMHACTNIKHQWNFLSWTKTKQTSVHPIINNSCISTHDINAYWSDWTIGSASRKINLSLHSWTKMMGRTSTAWGWIKGGNNVNLISKSLAFSLLP